MPFYPTLASAALAVLDETSGDVALAGSAAVYRDRDTLLTAAHCIPEKMRLFARLPGENSRPRIAVHIERHPTADLALVKLDPRTTDELVGQVYLRPSGLLIEGGDFHGVGYPAEGGSDGAVGRYFKGHFQRRFVFDAMKPYSYLAGEMSIPAPAGTSGCGLAYAQAPQELAAIVTTNHESYAIVDQFEEIDADGTTARGEIRRVVSYGIAVMLLGMDDWLNEHSSPPTSPS